MFGDTVGVQTGGGAVAVAAGFVTTTQAMSSGGGSIVIQADDVSLGAAVDATPAGLVQLTPRADGRAITLGGPGGLSLDAPEINLIRARLLAVGGVSVDVAGRGHSDWLDDPMAYQVPTYVADLLALLAHLRAEGAGRFGLPPHPATHLRAAAG